MKHQSEESKKYAAKVAEGILKDYGDSEKLDCDKAVFNAKDSINTMLIVGERNFRDGHIDQNEYNMKSRELKKLERRISKSECLSSKGKIKDFYKCMGNDYNHVVSCGKKYSYGD